MDASVCVLKECGDVWAAFWPRAPEALQGELVTLVASLEAEFFVEPVGVGTALVGRELDQAASPRPAFGDRPFEHLLAQSGITAMCSDSNRLDLSSPRTHACNAGDERKLKCADYLVAVGNHYQSLVRIGFYSLESIDISLVKRRTGDFSCAPEFVVGEQRDDRRDFG